MQSGNEIWPVYAILQNNFFYQEFYEKCGLETSSRPFLIFKESSVKKYSVEIIMLIWINFDRFAITNLSSLLQKFHLPIEVMLHSLCKLKRASN